MSGACRSIDRGTLGLEGRISGIMTRPPARSAYVGHMKCRRARHRRRRTMSGAMTISDESLERFIALCEDISGQRPTPAEARPMAIRLLELYRLITLPIPGEPPKQVPTEREVA
jgi:hypothetical protein